MKSILVSYGDIKWEINMNLYEKLKELEQEIKLKGFVEFTTPYGKNRKIIAIKDSAVEYEHSTGRISCFDIDLLYRDYFLLQDVGYLTADMLIAFNSKFKNGKKPCNITMFMLLMENFFGCKYIKGRKNSPSIIYW